MRIMGWDKLNIPLDIGEMWLIPMVGNCFRGLKLLWEFSGNAMAIHG
jgi:hypothetical protein